MLVINLANHSLDQIFERDQTICAAKFVNHQGHMDPRGLHFQHQGCGAHGGWHIQDLAAQAVQDRLACLRPLGLIGQKLEHVLNVNHANRIIQRVAIDRHARMACLDKGFQHLIKLGGYIDRDNISAGGHDIIDPQGLEGLGLINNIDRPRRQGRHWRHGQALAAAPV